MGLVNFQHISFIVGKRKGRDKIYTHTQTKRQAYSKYVISLDFNCAMIIFENLHLNLFKIISEIL